MVPMSLDMVKCKLLVTNDTFFAVDINDISEK